MLCARRLPRTIDLLRYNPEVTQRRWDRGELLSKRYEGGNSMAELVWLYLKRVRDDGWSIVYRRKKYRRCNDQAVRASQPQPCWADNAVLAGGL